MTARRSGNGVDMPSRNRLDAGGGFVARMRESMRTGYWVIPTVFIVGAMVAAATLVQVDRWRVDGGSGDLFGGGFESASQLLGTVASSTMAFTVLTFSIAIVTLQLASSQFSPRVLRTFLRDRGTQVPLGIFVATFVYSLLVLRTVRADDEGAGGAFVPGISVLVAIALAIACVGAFVYLINHVVHSIRVVTILDRTAGEGRSAIAAIYPETAPGEHPLEVPWEPADPPSLVVPNEGDAGVVVSVDTAGLVGLAAREDCVIELVAAVGDYVPYGAPLARVYAGGDGEMSAGDLRRHLGFGIERTMTQDVAFGLRQLVDIADKALSPGINDPTTVVQVVGRIEDLLGRIAGRADPPSQHRDDDGTVRLVQPVVAWPDLVRLAFEEIRLYGSGSVQVLRRLRAALQALHDRAPAHRRPPLVEQLRLVDDAARELEQSAGVRTRVADRQGVGRPAGSGA